MLHGSAMLLVNDSISCTKYPGMGKLASRSTTPSTPYSPIGPDSHMVVETNTSDYALAAILSIYTSDGEIHSIVFHSCSFNSAELNYDMHDKELLTIFKAFKHWHQYLKGSAIPVDVVTNHKNLEYFATTKLLTQHQA
jgi:RNase H-like domain found in reverse transcriptase